MCLKTGLTEPNQDVLLQKTKPLLPQWISSLALHAVIWMSILKHPYIKVWPRGAGLVMGRSGDWWEDIRPLEPCPQKGLCASICPLSPYVQSETGAFCCLSHTCHYHLCHEVMHPRGRPHQTKSELHCLGFEPLKHGAERTFPVTIRNQVFHCSHIH